MSLRINNNVAAFNTHRTLTQTSSMMGKSLEKLSSGLRINRAADDAAGLAISEGLRGQVGGLRAASRNAQDGISLIQTAEGAMNEMHSILQRMRELTVQAANDTYTTAARSSITGELVQLGAELSRIGESTSFNGISVLSTASTGTLSFQVGAGSASATNAITATVPGGQLTGISGVTGSAAYSGMTATGTAGPSAAMSALGALDTAIGVISTQRATLGALQNRLESTNNNLGVTLENIIASESRIRDTDMAMEMTNFTKQQILQQAGTSMLAQAQQVTQGVLSLLR